MGLKEKVTEQETPEQIRAKLADWWRADCADCAAIVDVIQDALKVDRSAALLYMCANRILLAAHNLSEVKNALVLASEMEFEQEEVPSRDWAGPPHIRVRRIPPTPPKAT